MRILSVSLFILSASVINSGVHAASRRMKCPIVEEWDDEPRKSRTSSRKSIIEGGLSDSIDSALPTRTFLTDAATVTDAFLTGAVADKQTYRIFVRNEENNPINVYFFTGPPDFDSSTGSKIFTNSLGTKIVGANNQVTFTYTDATFAGAQTASQPLGRVQLSSVSLFPVKLLENVEGLTDRIGVELDVNKDAKLTKNGEFPNGQIGAFEMKTQTKQLGDPSILIGTGAITGGIYLLTSYIEAEPARIYNIQPQLKFYIQIGSFQPGTVADFKGVASTSATIDTTAAGFAGKRDFFVTRTNLGEWEVSDQPSVAETPTSEFCSYY